MGSASTKTDLIRLDGAVSAAGLRQIESMAADNKSQGTIASSLGVTRKKFTTLLDAKKGENEVRLAWERGHAQLEQRVSDAMLAAGLGTATYEDAKDEKGKKIINPETGEPEKVLVRYVSKMGATQLIFFSKCKLGWQEKPTGALVQDNRIQISLPAPLSTEDYFKMLGQSGPMDFRKDKTTSLSAAIDAAMPKDASPEEEE